MLSIPILVIGGKRNEKNVPLEAIIQELRSIASPYIYEPYLSIGDVNRNRCVHVCTDTGVTTYHSRWLYEAWKIYEKVKSLKGQGKFDYAESVRQSLWSEEFALLTGISIDQLQIGLLLDPPKPEEIPYSRLKRLSQFRLALAEVKGQFGSYVRHITARSHELRDPNGERIKVIKVDNPDMDGLRVDHKPFPIDGFPDAVATCYQDIPICLRTGDGEISLYPEQTNTEHILYFAALGHARPARILEQLYLDSETRETVTKMGLPMQVNYAFGHLTHRGFIPYSVSVSPSGKSFPHFVVHHDLSVAHGFGTLLAYSGLAFGGNKKVKYVNEEPSARTFVPYRGEGYVFLDEPIDPLLDDFGKLNGERTFGSMHADFKPDHVLIGNEREGKHLFRRTDLELGCHLQKIIEREGAASIRKLYGLL